MQKYTVMVEEVREEVQEEHQPQPQEKQEGIPVLPNGDMVLSPEFFRSLIKTAVKEAVSEVVSECGLSKPHSNIRKITKPANWERVCYLKKAGKITTARAAELTGMSVSSFAKYYSGKSSF